jgi:phage/plasmid-like protein (TIGR03299 family)
MTSSLIDRYIHEPAFAIVGKRLDRPSTAAEAIQQAGLDFTVSKRPLKTVLPNGKLLDVPGQFVTVTQSGRVLGVVGDRYEVVQPADHFAFFDTLISRKQAVYVSAGLAYSSRKLWLLAKLPGHLRVGRDDIVNKYILLAGSFDGSLAIVAKICPFRFACWNQLSFALQSAGDEVRVKHTRSVQERLVESSRLLGLSERTFEQLGGIYNRLALRRISEKDLLRYVAKLIPDNQDAESNDRTRSIRQTICDLAEAGIGSNLNRMTAWSALQGATEWVDHVLSSHDPEKRFNTVVFGGGSSMKKKAFALANELFLS